MAVGIVEINALLLAVFHMHLHPFWLTVFMECIAVDGRAVELVIAIDFSRPGIPILIIGIPVFHRIENLISGIAIVHIDEGISIVVKGLLKTMLKISVLVVIFVGQNASLLIIADFAPGVAAAVLIKKFGAENLSLFIQQLLASGRARSLESRRLCAKVLGNALHKCR